MFLGIDGGGTKTEFLLIDESGRVLAAHRAGSAYYPETGMDALEALIAGGIRAALEKARAAAQDITFTCIGLPAYGEDSALTARLDAIATGALPPGRYRCVNDMVCGWAGALACRNGINVVAGTGSIAYGEFEGRTARAGGWGELFSDEGSAYWIAREALTMFSRMSDGRMAKGPLYKLIREYFHVGSDLDVCGAVYGPPALTRSQIAALAPLATQAVRAGDQAAGRLFAFAAKELVEIVHAVRDQLGVPAPVRLPVSYSGGMFQAGSALTPLLEDLLCAGDRTYEFVSPLLVPCAGIALYAAKLSKSPFPPEALTQLQRTHGASLVEAKS